MRPYRFLAVFAITGSLWAPRDAAAFCDVTGPYLGTGPKLPLGCPLHIYGLSRFDSPISPMITVLRNGSYIDATGSFMQTQVQLQVTRTFVDCQLRPASTSQTLDTYQRYAITPKDVQEGELIGYGSGWFGGIEIGPPGPCAAPIDPQPACTDVPFCGGPPPFDDFESDSCAAGGGSAGSAGFAIAALLLGLRAPRRRRR